MTKVSHHNVILDTIVGQNVWFGGYSGTANVLLDRRNIKYKMNDTIVDTDIEHCGSVIGNNCRIGASVIILPGRKKKNMSRHSDSSGDDNQVLIISTYHCSFLIVHYQIR